MKLSRWLGLVGLLALALVFAFNIGYFHQFVGLASKAKWYVLLLIIVAQTVSYFCNAKYYQSFFKLFGYEMATRPLFEASLAINFVNQVFPSGGVSGSSYLSRLLQHEIPIGKTTLAQLGYYVFTFLSFLLVLVLGFILLFLSNNLTRVTVRIVLFFVLLIIIVSLLLLTVLADRKRVQGVAEWGSRILNDIGARFFKRRTAIISHDQLNSFFDEFYEGYNFLLQDSGRWRKLLGYCLGGNVAEVATIYVVFLAFGSFINPGVVITAYTLANMFSIISVISAGAGLYEATMVASFVALGVPFALALSVVVVYRVLNFVLFLPAGYWVYRKNV